MLGCLIIAAPVAAQNRGEFVHDDAGFFSQEAKSKAEAEIGRMKTQFKKELVVDTVDTVAVPTDITANDTKALNRFIDSWADKRFKNEGVQGVYVVIVQKPTKFRIRVGNKTEQDGFFTQSDVAALEKNLISHLEAAKKDGMTNKAKNDEVLCTATSYVYEHFSQHGPRVTPAKQQGHAAPNAPAAHQAAGETPWLTYLLIGGAVLVVIWLVMGLLRGLTRGPGSPGMGGPGMAAGYGGGGGGGGGGFFSNMLGGMFGAAAGMWMYNNFFGGHSNSAWGAGPDNSNASNYGDNDRDTSSTGGGGDYGGDGGDQGGGDTGGGGGDWGGGGDGGGGGGDFGGGGEILAVVVAGILEAEEEEEEATGNVNRGLRVLSPRLVRWVHSMTCALCEKLNRLSELPDEDVVWQFAHSVALLGPWQYHTGYCVLVCARTPQNCITLPMTNAADIWKRCACWRGPLI